MVRLITENNLKLLQTIHCQCHLLNPGSYHNDCIVLIIKGEYSQVLKKSSCSKFWLQKEMELLTNLGYFLFSSLMIILAIRNSESDEDLMPWKLSWSIWKYWHKWNLLYWEECSKLLRRLVDGLWNNTLRCPSLLRYVINYPAFAKTFPELDCTVAREFYLAWIMYFSPTRYSIALSL